MPFSGKDETITCTDCKQPFVFTVGEQAFFDSKGFTDAPRRCKPCRDVRKATRPQQGPPQTQARPQAAQAAPQDDNYGNSWRDERPRRRRDE